MNITIINIAGRQHKKIVVLTIFVALYTRDLGLESTLKYKFKHEITANSRAYNVWNDNSTSAVGKITLGI